MQPYTSLTLTSTQMTHLAPPCGKPTPTHQVSSCSNQGFGISEKGIHLLVCSIEMAGEVLKSHRNEHVYWIGTTVFLFMVPHQNKQTVGRQKI